MKVTATLNADGTVTYDPLPHPKTAISKHYVDAAMLADATLLAARKAYLVPFYGHEAHDATHDHFTITWGEQAKEGVDKLRRNGSGLVMVPAEPDTDPGIREFVPIHEIEDRPLLPKAVIPYLAWPGLVTVVHGLGKVGKSELFSQALSARNTGQVFLGESFADRTRKIGIACEMNLFQAAAYVRHHGLTNEESAGLFFLQYPTEAERLQFVEKHNPGLLVIDTLTQLAASEKLDLNDAIAMRQFVTSLRQVSPDMAILLVHHTGWSGHLRNSTEILNAVDVAVEIDRVVKVKEDGDSKWIPSTDKTVTNRRLQAVGRGIFDTSILTYDRGANHYSIMDSGEAISKADAVDLKEQMFLFINGKPGCGKKEAYRSVHVSTGAAVKALTELLTEGRVRNDGKAGGRAELFANSGVSEKPSKLL